MKRSGFKILSALIMVLLILSGCGIKSDINSNNSGTSLVTSTSKQEQSVEDTASELTEESKSTKSENVLIVYYSLTNNTKTVADIIKDITGADVFVILPDFDYSAVGSRQEMEELGKKQVEEGFLPDLKNSVDNIDSYDTIIIGTPIWWGSATPPVMSFLSKYDLKGKKVVPFCTCGSSGGDYFTQIENAVPDSELLTGLEITAAELNDSEKIREKIKNWLINAGI